MKKFLIASASILLLPLSVNAGTVLPNLYADAYCEARDMGLTSEDAASYAMDDAYISTGNPPYVTYNGRRVQVDVLRATQAAVKQCPQYFG